MAGTTDAEVAEAVQDEASEPSCSPNSNPSGVPASQQARIALRSLAIKQLKRWYVDGCGVGGDALKATAKQLYEEEGL
jgi:hypothetical protein